MRGGREKKADGTGGQAEQHLGRSRGGFGTKVHAAVSGLGLPVRLVLTAGQCGDAPQATALPEGLEPAAVVADRAYDSDAIRADLAARGVEAVIRPLGCRREPPECDPDLYRERNLVERFWSKAKQYRRVAARYDKTARNFLAFVQVASIMILLK